MLEIHAKMANEVMFFDARSEKNKGLVLDLLTAHQVWPSSLRLTALWAWEAACSLGPQSLCAPDLPVILLSATEHLPQVYSSSSPACDCMLFSVPDHLLLSSFTGEMPMRCEGTDSQPVPSGTPSGPECRPAVLFGGRFSRCDQLLQVMRTQSRGKTLVPPSGLTRAPNIAYTIYTYIL